jgi:hypothetical protein
MKNGLSFLVAGKTATLKGHANIVPGKPWYIWSFDEHYLNYEGKWTRGDHGKSGGDFATADEALDFARKHAEPCHGHAPVLSAPVRLMEDGKEWNVYCTKCGQNGKAVVSVSIKDVSWVDIGGEG